ncbi:MAG: protein TolQ [Candidatus Thiothrix sulfatifontis]|uniref:Tol-Pal system protein TolQ n=2 Tax=Thiothrix subterranea TaxID=2735563 RepID=A0ABU0Y516_9GAMM|nr:protein TolQ [Thiothrix subterranea]MDQ5767225.1 protein TolQ [Thiothrix subterranea]QQZ28810.1 protein TolQ [Thiothrix subterranea]UOG92845.1 MAG: protein TolQ [Candidatus Thiothrix sulfatifontis]
MTTDLSILKLIMDASLVVKIVMILLVLASLLSWTLIMVKSSTINSTQSNVTQFEERFWSGVSLNSLYEELSQKTQRRGLERIFYDGFHEYKRALNTDPTSRLSVTDSVQRSMRVAASKEVDELERNLAFLATVGSTSPYVGLFGTVWGIMNSFISLGQMQQATLGVVAPGIAEALIATAIGLFAAIPAVIAYNRFSDKIDRLVVSYDNFREEFTALLERHAVTQRKLA